MSGTRPCSLPSQRTAQAPTWRRIKLHPEPGSGFGGVTHVPTLCRRADGASSVGSSFLQHPCDGDRLAGKAGPAHPFPSCSKVPPAMPCGHWGTKSPPPLWLRRSRSPRCRGAGVVRDSSPALHTLPAPPFLSSLPSFSPKASARVGVPGPSGCRMAPDIGDRAAAEQLLVQAQGCLEMGVPGNRGNSMCQHGGPRLPGHSQHATPAIPPWW